MHCCTTTAARTRYYTHVSPQGTPVSPLACKYGNRPHCISFSTMCRGAIVKAQMGERKAYDR